MMIASSSSSLCLCLSLGSKKGIEDDGEGDEDSVEQIRLDNRSFSPCPDIRAATGSSPSRARDRAVCASEWQLKLQRPDLTSGEFQFVYSLTERNLKIHYAQTDENPGVEFVLVERLNEVVIRAGA